MNRIRTQDRGFTLIELLIVMAIIGILAGIAIPVFLHMTGKAHGSAAVSDLRNLAGAEHSYAADQGTFLDTTAPSSDLGLRVSRDVQSVTVVTLNADGTRNGANGSAGFCAVATVVDGATYYYNSLTGGLTTTPCP